MMTEMLTKGEQKLKLYEINQSILDCVDEETGEILDVEKLESLMIERDLKIEQLALWYKNLLADSKAYEDEAKKFQTWKRQSDSKAEQIKKYIASILNGNKFITEKIRVNWRSSKSTEISDISKIPDEYLRFPPPEADKTKIKSAILSGVKIEGAKIVENKNISIV